jgi:hypothetical protein
VALFVLTALVATVSSTASAAVPAPPKVTPCGDIVAGTWSVRDRLSGKGLAGSHYSVTAINFPCARARTLVRKLTRRTSLMPGPAPLLPGFLCITGIPKGFQIQHGGCTIARSPEELMPRPDFKSFSWKACVAIPSRQEHMSCTTRKLP